MVLRMPEVKISAIKSRVKLKPKTLDQVFRLFGNPIFTYPELNGLYSFNPDESIHTYLEKFLTNVV